MISISGKIWTQQKVNKYLVEKKSRVGGENLIDAKGSFDQTEGHAVSFRFDTEGAQKFGKVTTNNIGKRLAIVLDNKIISAPSVREPITGGNGNISGNDPNLTFSVGDKIDFIVNTPAHPFYLKTVAGIGIGFNISGISNNGATQETISWTPIVKGTYYYQCRFHEGMVGTITIND